MSDTTSEWQNPDPDVVERLLNGALDDDLTAAETRLLEAGLASDRRFADEHQAFLELGTLLHMTSRHVPPAALRGRIMASLPPARQAASTRRRTTTSVIRATREAIASLVTPRPALALAAAVVVGLAAGATLFGSRNGFDPASSAGSIGSAPGSEVVVLERSLVSGTSALDLRVLAGIENQETAPNERLAEFVVRPGSGASTTTVTLRFDPSRVRTTAVVLPSEFVAVTVDPGLLVATATDRSTRFSVTLTPADPSVSPALEVHLGTDESFGSSTRVEPWAP